MKMAMPNYEYVKRFEKALYDLKPHINDEQEKIILDEIVGLDQEIKEKHYISAALRVGRTLEFVSYTIGKSLGIEINNQELKIINDLDQFQNKLKSDLLEYFEADKKNKEDRKNKISNQITEMVGAVIKMTFNFTSMDEPQQTNNPIPIPSIFRKLKKKI